MTSVAGDVSELMAATSQTPDARERTAAFLEKRAPRFD
jgi:enoyl-CoA hydratase/carnithine racemase